MSPREVLDKHTSREIAEWMAYERVAGPLDSTWDQEISAQMHELFQYLLDITMKANGAKKGWKVEHVSRPWPTGETKTKAPAKSPEETERQRENFYKTLAERNRRRGISDADVKVGIASDKRDK